MAFPGGNDGDEPLDTAAQFTLTGDDDVLPWLANDDEDEEDQRGGSDYRILIFAVVALLALGGILWAAKAFFDSAGNGPVQADGSTLEAPDGPYKERPDDPGGQDVAGTGDLSYEVGEGVNREGHLAPGEDEVVPSVDLDQAAARPATGASLAPAASPAASGGVGVQVGAFQTRESAETGWTTLTARYEVLQSVRHRVVEATVDGGRVYRLQAVAADGAAADALCRAIRNSGGDCQVKR
ncbi:SPOR domain-containing protein [Alteraurantiacibacter buctensis]|uniref:SPOR domain-containing protein n=1 Tax=Alteraurantiacibacter buctensis TaxID=1503981 RepID=A0A844Z4I6_9SPHN|nr:SPOR domain-containing protein [Alteraurantiacibacter buctensis]MXO72753.1 SPOR domain-containing protein [Alteraurantiacibacter buctensis]